jgi:type I restriction enzyme, S subunit
MVMPGYKQTEVGEIPEDWEELEIRELIDLLTGFPFPSSQYTDSGTRLLRGSNIKRGITDWDDDIVKFWPSISSDLLKYELKSGDIVIAMDGSLVGRSFAQLNEMDVPALLLQRVARIRAKLHINQDYLKEWICSNYFTYHCDSVKTVTAIPHISPGDIKIFKIKLPKDINEQKAIAKALSDVDELIVSLEKLIAKKRDIKTATMQQLLTGKKRLPGFGEGKGYKQTEFGEIPEDWMISSIGNVCEIYGRIGFRGYTKSDIVSEANGAITLSPSNIENNKIKFKNCTYISWLKYHESPEIKIQNNDVLLVKTGSTFGKTAIVEDLPREATLNPQLIVLKKFNVPPNYMGYSMQFNYIQSQITSKIVGGAIPTLSQAEVSSFNFPLPSSPKEQLVISKILTDMEKDINSLSIQLNKIKSIKQGMMQELLTGRTRLIQS